MCAFHLEFVELYILLQSTNEYCCKSHFIIGPSLLLAYLCLIVKLLNQKVEGACTKAHILNHPGSTFSCIPMSVVGMPLPSAGPNAECGSVHIIMHLQPNTSCPPSPAQPSPAAAWIPSIQSSPGGAQPAVCCRRSGLPWGDIVTNKCFHLVPHPF